MVSSALVYYTMFPQGAWSVGTQVLKSGVMTARDIVLGAARHESEKIRLASAGQVTHVFSSRTQRENTQRQARRSHHLPL
jgi:ABC-type enterobactin transport system permease subunit